MGSGKGHSTTTVQMTPEQERALAVQTNALEKTFIPAYENTVTSALDVANKVMPVASSYAAKASDVAARTGGVQEAGGTGAYLSGLGGTGNLANYNLNFGQGLGNYGASQLSGLFSPQYKQEQINAALQPVGENIREQFGAQDALFGGAGGAGSSRYALASRNLDSLSKARLGNVAAQVSANVEGQRQQAANTLLGAGQTATNQAGSLFGALTGAGQTGLNAANQAASSQIGYAGVPQDVLAKYAQVVYGTPQASTTPNFSGTQGGSTSSKSSGLKL